jgi:hypothetical protein
LYNPSAYDALTGFLRQGFSSGAPGIPADITDVKKVIDDATSARKTAETAKETADREDKEAKEAKAAAEAAEAARVVAEAAAEAARVVAEAARVAADAQDQNSTNTGDADQANAAAEQAKAAAEQAKAAAEQAKADADAAAAKAETEREQATEARTAADLATTAADQAKQDVTSTITNAENAAAVNINYDVIAALTVWEPWTTKFYALNKALEKLHNYRFVAQAFRGTNGADTTVWWRWMYPEKTNLTLSRNPIPHFRVENTNAYGLNTYFMFTISDLLGFEDDELTILRSTGFFGVYFTDFSWLRDNKPNANQLDQLTQINNASNCRTCTGQFPPELVNNALFEPGTIVEQLKRLKENLGIQ